MARLFVSYSHEDKVLVGEIVRELERKGHDVRIDEKFLSVGDPITTEIMRNLAVSDFVVVFLSSNSAASRWVCQEIYEALYLELQEKRSRLIPCLIEDCKLPDAFTKLKTYNRLYSDFTRDRVEAMANLLCRIDQGSRPVFENENYLVLNIAVPNLEIYLTGETWGWQKNSELRYCEMLDSYLLFGFVKQKWTYFKHFVLCDEPDASRIRAQLHNSGYFVGGIGDRDPETSRRRIWFCLREYPIEGSKEDNRWSD